MKRPYITNGFDRLSGPNLLNYAQVVKQKIDENFPTAPDLAMFTTKTDNFAAALTAAQQGGVQEKALRDQARTELIDEMHHMADWCQYTCNGDRTMLLKTGFRLNKENNTPSPAITAAKGQELTDGANSGVLLYSFDKVPGATSYIYEITPDPFTANTVWKAETGTVTNATFTGLESGKRYWVRVQALGKDGQCVHSEPISRISQ